MTKWPINSPTAEKPHVRECSLEPFSHCSFVVSHHHLGTEVWKDFLDLLEEQLVHLVFSSRHDNGQNSNRLVVVICDKVEHLWSTKTAIMNNMKVKNLTQHIRYLTQRMILALIPNCIISWRNCKTKLEPKHIRYLTNYNYNFIRFIRTIHGLIKRHIRVLTQW